MLIHPELLQLTGAQQLAVLLNMAIIKVFCLIGFVLLSFAYARKHSEHQHDSQHYGLHRYKHILKRHVGHQGISRDGANSKRSERVEESSTKIWQHQEESPGHFKVKRQYKGTSKLHENPNSKNRNTIIIPSGKKGRKQYGDKTPDDTVIVLPSGGSGSDYDVVDATGKLIAVKPTSDVVGRPGDGTEREKGSKVTNPSVEPEGDSGSTGVTTSDTTGLQPLPSFEKLQSGSTTDGTKFKITDDCSVTAKKIGTLYQLSSTPPDCVNLKILLEKVLPKDKANFESTAFMTLEHIIIRSVSLDTSTKGVEIAAAYTGTATLIKDILTVSNIRLSFSFVWTRSQKLTFDLAATFSIGKVPIDMRLIRNEEGYYFTADSTLNFDATTISSMFKQEHSFLPTTCLQDDLKVAKFDRFKLINPRLRATFADGYGFLFAGYIQILEWDPFDVNVLINKPNDLPTTVTIAVYTEKFSISKMLDDLFHIDIKSVPVLGTVTVRNLAFSLSTGDVETPLTVLDIGSEDIFDIPYRRGLKVSFEIPIANVYVATSIFISPTLISFTISQSGALTLGDVISEFLPGSDLVETTEQGTKLKKWPPFLPDPLSIALVYFHLEASKPADSWALTKMNIKLKLGDVPPLFNNKILINNLELDLNYVKEKDTSRTYGVALGRVALGSADSMSPRVDVRIPFPFKNEEITFTFSDFTVSKVVEALAGTDITWPDDFPEIFKNIQLDKIALTFDDKGSVKTVSVDASIPGLWHLFGDFSIGNVGIHFEYGKGTSGDGTTGGSTSGDGTSGGSTSGDGTSGGSTPGDGTQSGGSTPGDGTSGGSTPGDGTSGGSRPLRDSSGQSSSQSTWRIVVRGQIVIATCTIDVEADLGTNRLSLTAAGTRCSISIGDILEMIHLNGKMLPSMISGFTIFNPELRLLWQRTGDNAGAKSIAFAATTSLFHESEVELALIMNGGQSAVIAGFAVQSDAVPEIGFLSSLGLSELAVVYVSERVRLAPYEFINKRFNSYIQGSLHTDGADAGKPEFQGITIYARFVPKADNMLGHMLREGVKKDTELRPDAGKQPEIIVKISFPALLFELEVNLGDGLQIGDLSGWRFTYMRLIISKRLIGLSLKCKINLDSKNPDSIDSTFTGEVSFTFTGTITISLLWEGSWNNPLGISRRLTIRRMGLALGINVADLIPSFGITGAITVDVPSAKPDAPPIDVNLTLCIDPSTPDKTVFELHFTRLLLEDIINLFAGHPVDLPEKLAKVGFPDEVDIYFSLAGNPDCFGKRYDPGVEIHGTLEIPFLRIRARIDLSIALPPASFKLDASLVLDPIIYLGGLLKVVDADSDTEGAHLKVYITENLSDLKIDGSCRIEIFGAMISVKLQINSKKLFFEGRLNLWNLFQVYLLIDISMETKSPSLHIIGEMQNDLFAKIKQKASQAIQSGAREINKKIEGAQQKIRNAQHEVDRLYDSINYHKRKIEDAKHECSRAPWYKKWICIGTAGKIIYHGAIIAGLWIAHGVATLALKAADLFLEGVKGIIKVGADVLQTLVNAALSIIDIQYVRFEVELDGVTKIFNFDARIVILGWTFTPHFTIDFSSSHSANSGIDSAGQSISDKTMDQVKK